MARDPLLVVFDPTPDATLKPMEYKEQPDGPPYWSLVVHGRSRGLKTLTAELKEVQGGTGATYKPMVHKLGLHWVFVFGRLKPAADAITYQITLTPDVGAVQTRKVTLNPKLAAPEAPKRPFDTIPITNPSANANLCPFFVASGNVVNDPPNICTMTSANHTVNGAAMANPLPGTWVYTFTSVPEDSGYVFLVSNGSDQGSVGGITVDAAYCG